jgi:intein/homing endonuclease
MKEFESLGEWNGWQVYKNSDGFLEGYKSTGRKVKATEDHIVFTDSKRIVTNTKDMAGFIAFVNGTKKKEIKIQVKPMPKLFDETDLPSL